ncbi:MAG: type II toxin-antitoxin system ParD family antitoxin [Thermofilum sp.]|jgi:Arc/MetJ-type ribon-helix-helix transcriptional regulator|nr:type II toxin-antitoxin system ParD family antitoxin [Thermofilum sp.]
MSKSFYVTERGDYTSITKIVSVKLPVGLIDALDELIQRGYFQNRSDAIREAIRKLLTNYRELDSQKISSGLMIGLR